MMRQASIVSVHMNHIVKLRHPWLFFVTTEPDGSYSAWAEIVSDGNTIVRSPSTDGSNPVEALGKLMDRHMGASDSQDYAGVTPRDLRPMFLVECQVKEGA